MIGGQVPPAGRNTDNGNNTHFGFDSEPDKKGSSEGISLLDILPYAISFAALIGLGKYLIPRIWSQSAETSDAIKETPRFWLPEEATRYLENHRSYRMLSNNPEQQLKLWNKFATKLKSMTTHIKDGKSIYTSIHYDAAIRYATGYYEIVENNTVDIEEAKYDVKEMDGERFLKERVITHLTFQDKISPHLNEMKPSEAVSLFLRGELGDYPTKAEVAELFDVMCEADSQTKFFEVVDGRHKSVGSNDEAHPPRQMFMSIFSADTRIYGIYTAEFLSNLAHEIEVLAEDFRMKHGREPRIVEVAAGDGRLSRQLGEHGIEISATDNMSWKDVKNGSNVQQMDAVEAAKNADIVIASWLPPDSHVDLEIAKLLRERPGMSLVLIGSQVQGEGYFFYDKITGSEEFYELIVNDGSNRFSVQIPDGLDYRNMFSRADIAVKVLHEGVERETEVTIIRSNAAEVPSETLPIEESAELFTESDRAEMREAAQRFGPVEILSPEEAAALRDEASPEVATRNAAMDAARDTDKNHDRDGVSSSREAMERMKAKARDRSGKNK